MRPGAAFASGRRGAASGLLFKRKLTGGRVSMPAPVPRYYFTARRYAYAEPPVFARAASVSVPKLAPAFAYPVTFSSTFTFTFTGPLPAPRRAACL